MTMSFIVRRVEARIIREIASRAMNIGVAREEDPFSPMDIAMDITAVHCNGNPLRLEALRDADAFNFAHDVIGIRRHLDRGTGKLCDHFRPRFSA